jgi:hypothetical protein
VYDYIKKTFGDKNKPILFIENNHNVITVYVALLIIGQSIKVFKRKPERERERERETNIKFMIKEDIHLQPCT